MKKMKYISKEKVEGAARFVDEHRQINPNQTFSTNDVEELTEEDLLVEDVETIEDVLETNLSSPSDVEDSDLLETSSEDEFVEVSKEDLIEDEVVELDWKETQEIQETPEQTEEPKLGFWNKFKKSALEEPVKVVVEEPIKKEESSMSYSTKQSGYAQDAAAVISSTMVIRGDVELDTSLVFAGKIIGNVVCKDAVESKNGGSIEGNLSALSAEFIGGSVKGNVLAQEKIVIDEDTIIEGDVSAKDIIISGKVVGEVKASGSVKLTHTANIKGDLHAASVSIEAGARLEGKFIVSATE